MHDLSGRGAQESDPQRGAAAPDAVHRAVQCGGADLLVGRSEILVQPVPQRGQTDVAAGPHEQLGTDRAFLLLDRPADPGRRDVHPLGRPPEMQRMARSLGSAP